MTAVSRMPPRTAFTRPELRVIDAIHTPLQLQRTLRAMPYNAERGGETLRTFRGVVGEGKAHCLEAALFGATILERYGYPPIVLDIESQDGLDHVLLLFNVRGRWGTVARSRDWGLHGRPAVFDSISELVESYFDPFIDGSGRVVGYGTANLDELVRVDWRLSTKSVWAVERALIAMPHRALRMPELRYRRMLERFQAFKASGAPVNRRSMRALYGDQVARWW